jgi:hydrogenase-4 component F
MIALLIGVPLLSGLLAFMIRPAMIRRALLLAAAVVHVGLTASAWVNRPAPLLGGWLDIDSAGLLVLTITSGLFLAAAVYGIGFLRREPSDVRRDFEEGELFINAPEARFTGCLLLFLATMTLVAVSQHFGLLWVSIEATTLASAPLIYFHRHHRSLEATWKYLLICSVGIALALLGNFFLVVASPSPAGGAEHAPMTMASLIARAGTMNVTWLRAAFVLMLVGYGTKMGLAPMHTWLPDAHSEAPSMVSALLSGALLNCAFLGILRVHAVCQSAGQGEFSGDLLILLGLVSMGLAAAFIVAQADFKRMLAYSSIEHMGILAFGVGVGGAGAFGAMLHMLNHSLTKAMLFLAAGNILAAWRTKSTHQVRGLLHTLPVTGVLWVVGFLAITGSPPFGTFLSELTILRGALDAGKYVAAAIYLLALAIVFVAMAAIMLRMAHGKSSLPAPANPPAGSLSNPPKDTWLAVLTPALLGLIVLALGFYVPPQLSNLIRDALAAMGGR